MIYHVFPYVIQIKIMKTFIKLTDNVSISLIYVINVKIASFDFVNKNQMTFPKKEELIYDTTVIHNAYKI